MRINVMSWNMAGAKVFGSLDDAPRRVAQTYVDHFHSAWKDGILPHFSRPPNPPPDLVLLQECIGFVDKRTNPSGRWQTGQQILESVFGGYSCFFFPAFSSHTHPHPARWNRFRQPFIEAGENFIPDQVEAQQGYGVCVRDVGQLRRLWVDEPDPGKIGSEDDLPRGEHQYGLCFEAVHTTTGSYLGSRDTEPRLVVHGRLKLPDKPDKGRYVNFLNLHLTTLKGEREGNIRLDRLASAERLQQLDLILDNVVSAYQEEKNHRIPRTGPSRQEDIWIVAGDFNAAVDSAELELVRRVGFVDGNPDKRIQDATRTFQNPIGTKWSLSKPAAPPIVLDYILCGLRESAFPVNGVAVDDSCRPFRPAFPTHSQFESDHAVLWASFGID